MEDVLKINTKPVKTMNLSVLAEQCIYRLPGCSDLMLRKELQKTIIEMCEMTSVMTFPISFEVQPLEDKYYIALPFDLVLCRIDSVYTNHPERSKVNPEDFEIIWEPVPQIKMKRIYTQEEMNLIENGALKEPFEITVMVNAMPALGADDYPETFLRRWQSTIIAGTLARLFSMTGRPWSDPNAAAIEANSYNNGLNDIAVRRITQGIRRYSSINKNQSTRKSHWFI